MWMAFLVIEAHFLGLLSGYFFLFAIPLMELAIDRQTLSPFYQSVFSFIKTASALGGIPFPLMYAEYLGFHEFVVKHLDGKKTTRSWFEYFCQFIAIVWTPISGFCYLTLPSTYAALRILFTRREGEYVVAEKKIQ